jgi:hypothetical protein
VIKAEVSIGGFQGSTIQDLFYKGFWKGRGLSVIKIVAAAHFQNSEARA